MSIPGLRPLFERRVPQIVGIYLGASYGVVEFLDLITGRYVVSENWVTLALLVFALFVPSVLLVAWNHGRPGRDEWTRGEKIWLPTNLVGAVVVLWVVFSGRELGAATTTVTVMDEDGNIVQAEVAKSEFRHRLAIFYFANETGDDDRAWLGYGIPEAVGLDLEQDAFVSSGVGYIEALRRRGLESAVGAPLPLYREIAERSGVDYFLVGEVGGPSDAIAVETTLYDTGSSRPVAERSFVGADALVLSDSISVQLRRDLGIPSGHIREAPDASVSELLTEHADAFEAHVRGRVARWVHGDSETAAVRWEDAVALDPTFAMAHYELANVYQNLGRNDESPAAHRRAVEHAYRLPQRTQLTVRYFQYTRSGDRDKVLALLAMRVELFPDDAFAYRLMGEQLRLGDRAEEAIDWFKRGLEVDPSRSDILEIIGTTYERNLGRPDEAVVWYREYAAALPESTDAVLTLADFFRRSRQLDSARAYYRRVSVMDPGDVEPLLEIAELDWLRGDFGEAEAGLADAAEIARTSDQLLDLEWERAAYYAFRGEMREALRIRGEMHQIQGLSQFTVLDDTTGIVAYQYGVLGEPARAFEILTGIATTRPPPWDRRAVSSYLDTYASLRAEGLLPEQSPPAPIRAQGFDVVWLAVDSILAGVESGILECDAASELFRRVADDNPGQSADVQGRARIAACQRRAGDLEAAEENVRQALALVPADPYSLLELARIQRDRGSADKARATLATALSVLENADPEYFLARDARLLQTELGG